MDTRRKRGRMLRRICREELHSLYTLRTVMSVITSEMMKWTGNSRNGNIIKMIVGFPEGKRLLCKRRNRREDTNDI